MTERRSETRYPEYRPGLADATASLAIQGCAPYLLGAVIIATLVSVAYGREVREFFGNKSNFLTPTPIPSPTLEARETPISHILKLPQDFRI